MKVDNILQTIGNTPHVRINRLFGPDANVWVKSGRGNPGGAAHRALTLGGKPTLGSARRWKAATHGVEPLRDLHAAMQGRDASAGVYVVTQGLLSDNARAFARDHGITVLQGEGVARLLLAAR